MCSAPGNNSGERLQQPLGKIFIEQQRTPLCSRREAAAATFRGEAEAREQNPREVNAENR